MERRLLIAILPLALVVGALFTATSPTSVLAASNPADPDGNPYTGWLAGRPITGTSYDDLPGQCPSAIPLIWVTSLNTYGCGYGSGNGIAYGRVNGQIVLFYPYHGRQDANADNKFVYGPNFSKIGYFAPLFTAGGTIKAVCDGQFASTDTSTGYDGDPNATFANKPNCLQEHDLAYIILYQGNWPSILNRVYNGNDNPYEWFTITQQSSSGTTCATTTLGIDYDQAYHDDTHDTNYADFNWTTGRDGTSAFTGDDNHCTFYSNVPVNPPFSYGETRPSGAAFILDSSRSTVSGFGTARTADGYVTWSPLFEGMQVLYHYEQLQGASAGLCITSTC